MYESPITRITEDIMKDIVKREEDYLVESVRKEGFNIDKEELAKALQYDRDQYEKGFRDGRLSAEPRWIPVTERLPEEECKHYWICTDRGYQCECRWTNVNHFWTNLTTDWHWNIFDVPQYSHVVAWMPLPECYRGEKDGE